MDRIKSVKRGRTSTTGSNSLGETFPMFLPQNSERGSSPGGALKWVKRTTLNVRVVSKHILMVSSGCC